MSKAKRVPLVAKIIIGLLIAIVVVLFAGRLWFRLPIHAYYKASNAAFNIPGLTSSYVPQGLEYVKETDQLLFTGYNKNGKPSPLYVVDAASGKLIKQVTFTFADGTVATTHNGGIEAHGGFIYLCDSHTDMLRVFSFAELQTAANDGTIHEIASVPLSAHGETISPAFVEAGPDGLIVGEFYRAGSYETPKTHYVGDHHALAVLLPYDDASETGVAAVPTLAYSLPDLAQGMCFDELGLMYVSESWGASPSTIEVYEPGQPTGDVNVLGVNVPLIMLDQHNRVSAMKIAPMAEEMAYVNGKLYVNCESASTKYLFGVLNGAHKIYATDIHFFRGDR